MKIRIHTFKLKVLVFLWHKTSIPLKTVYKQIKKNQDNLTDKTFKEQFLRLGYKKMGECTVK